MQKKKKQQKGRRNRKAKTKLEPQSESTNWLSSRWQNLTRKQTAILFLFLSCPIIGVAFAFLPSHTTTYLDAFIWAPWLACVVTWCLQDAKEREIQMGMIQKLSLIFVFPIGFLVYAFRSRGPKGVGFVFIGSIIGCLSMFLVFISMAAVLLLGFAHSSWYQ